MLNVMKKPLNMLENPMYPDIRKGGPIFKDAKKNNIVDAGRVMMETQHYPEMNNYCVLVQSRDRNKQHQYGVSSHVSVVNKEFRPPLLDPYLDNYSLTRAPVKIKPIHPGTINPGNAEAYTAPNSGVSEVDSYITDDVKGGAWRINNQYAFEKNIEVLLPDLETKIQHGTLSAGFKYRDINGINPMENLLLDSKLVTSATSRTTHGYYVNNSYADPFQVRENDKLNGGRSAGYETGYRDNNIYSNNQSIALDESKITNIASAGFTTEYVRDAEYATPFLGEEKINPIFESRQQSN